MASASLELKIPPPLLGLACALMMGALGYAFEGLPLATVPKGIAAGLLALAGLAFDVAGLVAFRRARTTINPLRPQKSSSLVSGGVYRHTRNPMYVGMACILLGWAVWLAQPLALLGPVMFVLYITRFQIRPEEKVLMGLFGEEFTAYAAKVRRWL